MMYVASIRVNLPNGKEAEWRPCDASAAADLIACTNAVKWQWPDYTSMVVILLPRVIDG